MNADFSSYPSHQCKSASKNFFFPLKSEEPFFLTEIPKVTSLRAYLFKTVMRFARTFGGISDKEFDIPRQRKMEARFSPQAKLPVAYVVEPVKVNGVDAEWVYHQQAPADKVVIDIHGGAFILGSIDLQRRMVLNIAKASGARCISVGYRLAPEHPYPAGLDDCLAVYRWLVEQGVSPERIVLVGDSAGGTLALAATLALKDKGEPLPAALVLVSPCTDIQGTGESVKTKARAEAILPANIFTVVKKYYAQGKNLDCPYVSPLYGDYRGFPPMLIHVGTDEILLDDSIRLAEKARVAGVKVNLKLWPGMFHDFVDFDMLPEAKQSIREMGEFIRDHLGTSKLDDGQK